MRIPPSDPPFFAPKRPPKPYPPSIVPGPAYRDPGDPALGSFIVRQPPGSQIMSLDADFIDSQAPVKLYVTSTKSVKVLPARDFALRLLQKRWPDFHVNQLEVMPMKCSAEGINPQPIENQGLEGAIGRCRHPKLRAALAQEQEHQRCLALQGKPSSLVLVVSFENYSTMQPLRLTSMPQEWKKEHLAEYSKGGKVHLDLAAIHMQAMIAGVQQSISGFSDGVALPYRYLEESAQTDYQVTVGQLIARDFGLKDSNWQGEVTSVDRPSLLYRGAEQMGRLQIRW